MIIYRLFKVKTGKNGLSVFVAWILMKLLWSHVLTLKDKGSWFLKSRFQGKLLLVLNLTIWTFQIHFIQKCRINLLHSAVQGRTVTSMWKSKGWCWKVSSVFKPFIHVSTLQMMRQYCQFRCHSRFLSISDEQLYINWLHKSLGCHVFGINVGRGCVKKV